MPNATQPTHTHRAFNSRARHTPYSGMKCELVELHKYHEHRAGPLHSACEPLPVPGSILACCSRATLRRRRRLPRAYSHLPQAGLGPVAPPRRPPGRWRARRPAVPRPPPTPRPRRPGPAAAALPARSVVPRGPQSSAAQRARRFARERPSSLVNERRITHATLSKLGRAWLRLQCFSVVSLCPRLEMHVIQLLALRRGESLRLPPSREVGLRR